MKAYVLPLIAALAFPSVALAAGDHANEAKPLHGGVVSVVKDVSYELVVTKDRLAIHVSDHGKPVDLAGATGKVVTLLSGSAKEEAVLVPAKDALEAKGPFTTSAGTKVAAQVTLKGQATQSVRFTMK